MYYMKKSTSFRIEEQQVAQLDKLVEYYKGNIQDATSTSFHAQVSKASILEMLIKDKFNELNLHEIE